MPPRQPAQPFLFQQGPLGNLADQGHGDGYRYPAAAAALGPASAHAPAAAAKPRPKAKPRPSRPQWMDNWGDDPAGPFGDPPELRPRPDGPRGAPDRHERHPAHAPPPQPGGPFAEDEDEAGEGEEPAGEDEEEDPEVRRLQEEHTKLMDCILEEEDDMVDFQRAHVDQKMELVKKELDAMELLDRGKCGVDEYVSHLDAILAQQIQLLHEARERLQQFQNHLLEEEILNSTVIKRTMNRKKY
eukprot:EG_transcript_16900